MTPEMLCMGCMAERGESPLCPRCGWVEGSPAESPLQLPPRTVLDGKYLIGRSLGQGGFGITYLAWDLNLEFKVAVKEYFPRELCTRARDECTVQALTGSDREAFRDALKTFVDEGRALARFRDYPGIVSVLGFFQENGTGYLAMAYLEGLTLKQHLANSGGKIPFESALQILLPVMDALREVHRAGMLHRDISPDNIYLTRTSQVKLLDFGNARYLLRERSHGFSAILKPGYAPEEQFRRQGRQGPWTDVYALAATLYRALTGRTPPEAPDRLAHDDLVPPSQLGVVIPQRAEKALLKALAVRREDRFQSVDEFEEKLAQLPLPPPPPPPPDGKIWKRVATIAALLVVVLLAVYWIIVHRPKTGSLTVTANVAGAKISIDGQGQPDWFTPHTFPQLAAGTHDVTAVKEGYQAASQSVNVRAGADNSLLLNLPPPLPQFGALTVRASVDGAKILIDGETQSDWLTPHTFPSLAARTYVITVQKEAYQPASQRVSVEAGNTASVEFDLNNPKVVQKAVDQFGQLQVTANVQGAKILIDGLTRPGWVTPHTFASLPARAHTVTLMSDGYQTASKTVAVVVGGIRYSKFDLSKSEPPKPDQNSGVGELVVTSDPTGARIVIDGADTGFSTPHTFSDLSVRSHTVALLKDGFDSTARAFSVEAGKSVPANIQLSRPMERFTLAVLEVSSGNREGVPIVADVFIDGKSYGRSPVKTDLSPGEHHYKVTVGSRTEEGKFEIKGGLEVGEVDVKIPKAETN